MEAEYAASIPEEMKLAPFRSVADHPPLVQILKVLPECLQGLFGSQLVPCDQTIFFLLFLLFLVFPEPWCSVACLCPGYGASRPAQATMIGYSSHGLAIEFILEHDLH